MPPIRSGDRAEDATGSGLDALDEVLRPFAFHGVDILKDDGPEAVAQCPWCGKDKLHIETGEGMFNCKTCGVSGNPQTFLRLLWDAAWRSTDPDELGLLMEERGLLTGDSLAEWGVAFVPSSREWVVPGYGTGGLLDNLYSWRLVGSKRRLHATKGYDHCLHGPIKALEEAERVYVCEGPWDGMALWEVLRSTKPGADGELELTGNAKASLLGDGKCAVIATPGANVFKEQWLPLLAGKEVVLCFDNDHERLNRVTNRPVPGAGVEGMKRVARMLVGASKPPRAVLWHAWGEQGYDPDRPDGMDMRDILRAGASMRERVAILSQEILPRVQMVPGWWLDGVTPGSGGSGIHPKKCDRWSVLQNAWRGAMKWTPGLDRALAVMLSSIASTMAEGDQLWVKIISPPSTGKSTLCEALSANRKYTFPTDTFTGLTSGYQPRDGDNEENFSMAQKINGKTLIINDGDTLLNLPNLGQVLSQLRAFYGRNIRSQYKNKMSKNHEGVSATVILCGTPSLHKLDDSELGDRFLHSIIVDKIDDELEDEILRRQAAKVRRSVGREVNCEPETHYGPDLLEATRLTSGYINWLRASAIKLADKVEWSEDAEEAFIALAKFVSYFRARPSGRQEEVVEREMAARLLSQLMRLGTFMAVVMNRTSVDYSVLQRCRAVALDTARGRTLSIADVLWRAGEDGRDPKSVAYAIAFPEDKTRKLLIFLQAIGVVEIFQKQVTTGYKSGARYRLTGKMQRLYEVVAAPVLQP